jgi:hypothetical protein
MRDGYLGALAARTLGVAPLLRPATPSRFEPDRISGRLEMAEVGETVSERPAPEDPLRPPRGAALDEPGPETGPADAPLLPRLDPDRPRMDTAFAAPLEESQDPALGTPAADPGVAALGIAALAQAFAAPDTSAEAVGPLRSQGRGFARAAASAGRVADSGSRRSSAPGNAEAPQAPVPVIVRIGRIDVRAGEAAPRPVPVPPRPAGPAGRSLAEHLAARDRELS